MCLAYRRLNHFKLKLHNSSGYIPETFENCYDGKLDSISTDGLILITIYYRGLVLFSKKQVNVSLDIFDYPVLVLSLLWNDLALHKSMQVFFPFLQPHSFDIISNALIFTIFFRV